MRRIIVLVFLHKSSVGFFGTEFILILLISLSVTSMHKTASHHFENFAFVILIHLLVNITSNMTDQLVEFVIFTCAKILIADVFWLYCTLFLVPPRPFSDIFGSPPPKWLIHFWCLPPPPGINNKRLCFFTLVEMIHLPFRLIWFL
jgi:hypothetical protein